MSLQKLEFLVRLERELEEIPPAERKEIMSDFEAHFQEAMEAGKSEEEILNSLGNVQTIANEILEQHREHPAQTRQSEENVQAGAERTHRDNEMLHVAAYAAGQSFRSSSSSYNQDNDDTLSIRVLRIQTSEVDVAIESYEGDRIGYRLESDEPEKFDIRDHLDGDTYTISARLRYNAKRFFSFLTIQQLRYSEHKLYVRVPSSYQGHLQITSDSGDIDMQQVRSRQLDMELSSGDADIQQGLFQFVRIASKSGDIHLDGCSAEQMSVVASSGDIDVRRSKTHTMEIQTSSGDVEVGQISADELRAEVMSGDLSIREGVGLNWALSSSSGDMELEYIRSNLEIISRSGEVEIDELNGSLMLNSSSGDVVCSFGRDIGPSVIESASGDIDVRISSLVANINIEAITSSGDLTVKLPHVQTETERRDHYRGSIGYDGPVVRIVSASGDIELRATRA